MNIFTEVRSSQQKILGILFFLFNKRKNRSFLENCGHRNSVLETVGVDISVGHSFQS